MKQYELWWAERPKPGGRRLVLLLSRDSAYAYLNKYIVVEITSTIRNIAVEVPLGKTEGLARPCVANCDNVRTVSRSTLTGRIGHLAAGRHAEVKRALGHSLAWDELIGAA